MHRDELISVPALLLDTRNARLKDEQPTQQDAILALTTQQGRRILALAEDIVGQGGLDPLSTLAVVESATEKGHYVVIEGNRRLVALKGLQTPSLVLPALDAGSRKRWAELSKRYAPKPVGQVRCVVFDTEEEAIHWVSMRHTGQNNGAGIVEWGADEKDRFRSRHGVAGRAPAGQVLDFVDLHNALSDEARASTRGVITNVDRMFKRGGIMDRLGIQLDGKTVLTWYPAQETARVLGKIVSDLRTGRTRVGDIYHEDDRAEFAAKLEEEHLPDPALRLAAPVPLGEAPIATPKASKGRAKGGAKGKVARLLPPRDVLIPGTAPFNINQARVGQIYRELRTLELSEHPNAIAVSLRLFVELSVDHYIVAGSLMPENARRNAPLAKRLKAASADMLQRGLIDAQLDAAIQNVANGKGVLCADLPTFNQYVHNRWVLPSPADLRTAWDELEPLLTRVWP